MREKLVYVVATLFLGLSQAEKAAVKEKELNAIKMKITGYRNKIKFIQFIILFLLVLCYIQFSEIIQRRTGNFPRDDANKFDKTAINVYKEIQEIGKTTTNVAEYGLTPITRFCDKNITLPSFSQGKLQGSAIPLLLLTFQL